MKTRFVVVLLLICSFSFAQTTSPRYEKLVFHTGVCFGFCPVYHLELLRNRQIRVQIEKSFSKQKQGPWVADTANTGYFQYRISRKLLRKIDREIEATGLRNMQPDSTLCCDGSLKTIILYFGNGERSYYKTMFPSERLQTLITLLTRTAAAAASKRRTEPFELEQ